MTGSWAERLSSHTGTETRARHHQQGLIVRNGRKPDAAVGVEEEGLILRL